MIFFVFLGFLFEREIDREDNVDEGSGGTRLRGEGGEVERDA